MFGGKCPPRNTARVNSCLRAAWFCLCRGLGWGWPSPVKALCDWCSLVVPGEGVGHREKERALGGRGKEGWGEVQRCQPSLINPEELLLFL